jgi:rhamnulokinase
MGNPRRFVAIDLGASNGRLLLGRWDGARFDISEVHRFGNGPVSTMGHLHWDVLSIWAEIKSGLACCIAGETRADGLAGLGLDTWGVDYALLDREGKMLGNPYHYRDRRNDGTMELVFGRVPRSAVYDTTGIQTMQINTLFQLFSMVRDSDPQLEAAKTLLPMPNLFSYWLSGQRAAEYTIATTTQCLAARDRRWAVELMGKLDIPTAMFPPIVEPGVVLGHLLPDVAAETGLPDSVPVISVGCHDTASAVAAIPGLDTRSAYISSGTWSLMGVEVPAPIINEQSQAGNFTNEGGVGGTIRLLRNIPGLWLIQECRRQWQREGSEYTWEGLLDRAEREEPFRHLIDPEAPELLNPPDMPAAIRALCRRTGQEQPETVGAVVRCCLESLALRYRQTLADLEQLVGHSLEVVRIVGGGSQNRLLCQMAADACGIPVVAGPVEATALGNLMVQAIATGDLDDVAAGRAAVAASVTLDSYEPQPGAAWDAALSRLSDLAASTPTS